LTNLKISGVDILPLNIDTKPLMENYLRKIDVDISDYTFVANYIWFSYMSPFYAIINDTFVLFAMNGGELSLMLPPFGELKNIPVAIEKSFEIMLKNNDSTESLRIDYVDEQIIKSLLEYYGFTLENLDSFEKFIIEKPLVDYIYKTQNLIELKGNNYHTKRTEVNKFLKNYPNHRIEPLDPLRDSEKILKLFYKWSKSRIPTIAEENIGKFLDGILYEHSAIKIMLREYHKLELLGVVLYVDDNIIGFSIGEMINKRVASVIFEKTDFDISGSAQYIYREFSKILRDIYGSEYINAGDDMGFENLKKVKMSYRPEKLVPKYTIRVK
jgi:hypothetical protein